MEIVNDIFLTNVHIDKVRHLRNLDIRLSESERKHLILTGKNGSGKTSLLEAMAGYLKTTAQLGGADVRIIPLTRYKLQLQEELSEGNEAEARKLQARIEGEQAKAEARYRGLTLTFNTPSSDLQLAYENGVYVLAFYKCDRTFTAVEPKQIEKVELKENYAIEGDYPRKDFVKFLLDLKMTQALAASNGNQERADEIATWFNRLQDRMRRIFDDPSVKIVFDEETFRFSIAMDGREPFDFNSLSSGYAAVFDIVLDLMMRMKRQLGYRFDFDLPGIVLIDEIETHLHLELQREILPLLVEFFPNIQFVISSHSPFILNSVPNVVIYDLESHTLVRNDNGLTNVPYDGIVEGYFGASELSQALQEKFERYRELAGKTELSDDDMEELAHLEIYLDEIPDYLGLDIAAEYARIKLELHARRA